MTAASPVPERRRSRPGSLERPINARLYRGTWLLVGLPLLLLAFSVAQPPALHFQDLPPAFDAQTAAAIATDLASNYPDRRPGSADAKEAAAWFRRQLEPYGFDVRSDPFTATIATRCVARHSPRVPLRPAFHRRIQERQVVLARCQQWTVAQARSRIVVSLCLVVLAP